VVAISICGGVEEALKAAEAEAEAAEEVAAVEASGWDLANPLPIGFGLELARLTAAPTACGDVRAEVAAFLALKGLSSLGLFIDLCFNI
jgi:hypothetical protein